MDFARTSQTQSEKLRGYIFMGGYVTRIAQRMGILPKGRTDIIEARYIGMKTLRSIGILKTLGEEKMYVLIDDYFWKARPW